MFNIWQMIQAEIAIQNLKPHDAGAYTMFNFHSSFLIVALLAALPVFSNSPQL
jgi:hypothetical protein